MEPNHTTARKLGPLLISQSSAQCCGSGMGKKSGSGSGMNNSDHIFVGIAYLYLTIVGALYYFIVDKNVKTRNKILN